MDIATAFSRRRRLSLTIWLVLAACAVLTGLQTIFSFSIGTALMALVLGGLAWSERRACRQFAALDIAGAKRGCINQLLLGAIAGGYLLWRASHLGEIESMLRTVDLPPDQLDGIVPLIRRGYLFMAAAVVVSQLLIALYYARLPRMRSQRDTDVRSNR